MKTAPAIGLCLLGWMTLASPGQQPFSRALPGTEPPLPRKDVRVVAGKEVDLTPVHQWLARPVGDRPLKHWKQLQILEMKGNLAGYSRCVVKMEDDVRTELLIANLPPEPAAFLKSANQRYAAILAMRAQVAADEKAIDSQVDHNLANPPTYSSVVSGNTTVSDTPRARTQNYVAATRKLDEDRKTLLRLEQQYQEFQETSASQTAVLAMFTGQSYAKSPIWDCGKKK